MKIRSVSNPRVTSDIEMKNVDSIKKLIKKHDNWILFRDTLHGVECVIVDGYIRHKHFNNNEIETLYTTLNKMNNEIKDSNNEIKDLNNEIKDLNNEIKDLNKQIEKHIKDKENETKEEQNNENNRL